MKKVILSLLILCSVLFITGCGKKNELLGTWEGMSSSKYLTTIEFKKDGKMFYKNKNETKGTEFESNGKYTIKDDVLTIELEKWDTGIEYNYKIENNKLSLIAKEDARPNYV